MEVVIIAFLTQKEFEDLGFDDVEDFEKWKNVLATLSIFTVVIAMITKI